MVEKRGAYPGTRIKIGIPEYPKVLDKWEPQVNGIFVLLKHFAGGMVSFAKQYAHNRQRNRGHDAGNRRHNVI